MRKDPVFGFEVPDEVPGVPSEILIPKNLEKKVAAVYGPGWRTPDPLWKKIRTPEILAYREQISLTAEDLLEVAAVSQREGKRLRQLVESGQFE